MRLAVGLCSNSAATRARFAASACEKCILDGGPTMYIYFTLHSYGNSSSRTHPKPPESITKAPGKSGVKMQTPWNKMWCHPKIPKCPIPPNSHPVFKWLLKLWCRGRKMSASHDDPNSIPSVLATEALVLCHTDWSRNLPPRSSFGPTGQIVRRVLELIEIS